MNLAIYGLLAAACFAFALLNGFYQDRDKTSGMFFCIITPLTFLVFSVISGNLSSTYNALYLTITLAVAFYVATEACTKQNNAEKILKGILNIASVVLLVLGSISLAPFTVFGLLGGFLFGGGFGFVMLAAKKDFSLSKKIICFIEFLFSGAIFGCSFSSMLTSTHIVSAALYLTGAVLLMMKYLLRTFFGQHYVVKVISRIVFGLSMIAIISSIFFY